MAFTTQFVLPTGGGGVQTLTTTANTGFYSATILSTSVPAGQWLIACNIPSNSGTMIAVSLNGAALPKTSNSPNYVAHAEVVTGPKTLTFTGAYCLAGNVYIAQM